MKLSWKSDPQSRARHGEIATALDGLFSGPVQPSPIPAGRTASIELLHKYDVIPYGKSRNFTDAPVSKLSPYLRHGMLSMREVQEHLQQRFRATPQVIEEFLRQLAWRDFFLKVLDWVGSGIWEDLEEPKHGVSRQTTIPLDVIEGRTGLPCIDGMLQQLFTEGYLHNHERLWFAAYWCHFRRLPWQEGAKLFLRYLLDGDLASNNCSWQWVESTFASKPYFMNQENIQHFSKDRWCSDCRTKCPFRGSYEALEQKLF